MTSNNPADYNYHTGKIRYNEFKGTSTDKTGLVISLDAVIERSEKTEEQDISNPSEAWFMAGLNKSRK